MATVEELYQNILSSESEKAAFAEAIKTGNLAAFLSERGCTASKEEILAFLGERRNAEMADEELEAVAGGCNDGEAAVSALTIGFGCAFLAIESAARDVKGDNGQLLCSYFEF